MRVHYFQRYHSKENVDTSNTMLMLSRLYDYNADKFFMMLNDLILEQDESPEILFELQVHGDESVPDAVISQKSFKIVVETKLHNQFDKAQLVNHLKQFGTEDIKVLLTLDPKPMKEKLRIEIEQAIKQYNEKHHTQMFSPVKHINLTFEKLISAMEDIVEEHDIEMIPILEDFKDYCMQEKLVPDGYKWMRALTAGTTFEDNIALNLYYDDASHNYSAHGYIGLYKKKSVRAIGKLKKTILAEEADGKMQFEAESGGTVTEDEKSAILEAVQRAEKYGYNLRTVRHRYFFVEQFYPTDFKKSSKNPIQKSKLFNLAEMLNYKTMPDTKSIASDLDGKTWENTNGL